MKVFLRFLDFLIFLLVLVGGLYGFANVARGDWRLFSPVAFSVFYYSLAVVSFVFLFVFAFATYFYLLSHGSERIARLRSLAAVLFLASGSIVLLGVIQGLLETAQPFYYETVWLSYSLLWAMLATWFLLHRYLARQKASQNLAAIFGLLIALHFPLVLTAFSYHLYPLPPTGFALRDFNFIAALIFFLALLFIRFYFHFLPQRLTET